MVLNDMLFSSKGVSAVTCVKLGRAQDPWKNGSYQNLWNEAAEKYLKMFSSDPSV